MKRWLSILCLASAAFAQGPLDPNLLKQQPTSTWPTYHGDYSGRHFSTLKQINDTNVNRLTLAWMYRMNLSTAGAIIGGEGPETPSAGSNTGYGAPSVKSIPLMVNGILYFTAPDHAYAVDARTGREIWHYYWKTRGGIHIGSRGFGMYNNWLFFETPDCYIVSLEATTGEERWHHQIADVKQEYFCTPAPLIIGNHVLVGMGGDSLDVAGWLEARDPETGDIQWKWFSTPRPGQPGAETWTDQYSMEHGGGMPWQPPTYDPELNLLYVPTGNPNPVMAGQSRQGDNLWTASIVALNPDTGKMAWYFQASPHDTHDWDATQVPVLVDATIAGQPRKLLAQANRNGYYFLLDRTDGKNVTTKMISERANWQKSIDGKGQPVRNTAKDPQVPGVLVSPNSSGFTNWPPPSYSPDSGLFYVGTNETYSLFYLTDTDAHPQGYGAAERNVATVSNTLRALDVKTGNMVWTRATNTGAQGLLSTAGNLLFGGDGNGNFIAFNAKTGKPLWHAGLNVNHSNGPSTWVLDGKQYVIVGAGDTLYAFVLQ